MARYLMTHFKVSYSKKQPTLGNSGFILVNQETQVVIAVVLGK